MKHCKHYIAILMVVLIMTSFCGFTGIQAATLKPPHANNNVSVNYAKSLNPGYNLVDIIDPKQSLSSFMNSLSDNKFFEKIKKEGFVSVRIPVSFEGALTLKQSGDKIVYTVNSDLLEKYRYVVQYAIDAKLKVILTLSEDSIENFKNWDGSTTAVEYQQYIASWNQIADKFSGYRDDVSFELLDHPTFASDSSSKIAQLIRGAYKEIRSFKTNESRMILLPTIQGSTKQEDLDSLYSQIATEFINVINIFDSYLCVSVQYFGEPSFSCNAGLSNMDEPLKNALLNSKDKEDKTTSRDAVANAFKQLNSTFVSKGIGVVCTGYGMTPQSDVSNTLAPGENIEFIQSINETASKYGISLFLSDIDNTKPYFNRLTQQWSSETLKNTLKVSYKEKSAYIIGNNFAYISNSDQPVKIKLNSNNCGFNNIDDNIGCLSAGKDYTYSMSDDSITISKSYLSKILSSSGYDIVSTLQLDFQKGLNCQFQIYKCSDAVFSSNIEKNDKSITIPVTYNGNHIARICAFASNGCIGSKLSGTDYLQCGKQYYPDYERNTLTLDTSFFKNTASSDILFEITMRNGKVYNYRLALGTSTIDGIPDASGIKEQIVTPSIPDSIVMYVGETNIDPQLVTACKGYGIVPIKVTGNGGSITSDGTLKLSNREVTEPSKLSFLISQYNSTTVLETNFTVRIAPKVPTTKKIDLDGNGKLKINNLAKDAIVTYTNSNPDIASITDDGKLNGLSKGATIITISIKQYGREHTYQTEVVVK